MPALSLCAPIGRFVALAIASRLVALCLHESAHALTARLLGYRSSITISLLGQSWTTSPGLTEVPGRSATVRHAGWLASVALAVAALYAGVSLVPLVAFWLTALDGVYTDLLGGGSDGDVFCCGNFGLLLLDKAASKLAKKMIATSVRVTMMRGAQSAGIVTYIRKGKRHVGQRRRVVNGKVRAAASNLWLVMLLCCLAACTAATNQQVRGSRLASSAN